MRALTLHSKEGAEGTPAISSNYLRVNMLGKLAANEWVEVTLGEDGITADRIGAEIAS